MTVFHLQATLKRFVVLLSKGAEQSGTENGRQQKCEGGLLPGGYGFI